MADRNEIIALSSYKLFHNLMKEPDARTENLGFLCEYREINELNNRYRLARSFRGINLEGYTEKTSAGYNGFMQVFLTHSALERFFIVFQVKKENLGTWLVPYEPKKIVKAYLEADKDRLLFDFLHSRVNNDLKKHLTNIYAGEDENVAQLSAAIRHIFAHGILTAHANGINPIVVNKLCNDLSNFLLNFMDSEFTKRVMAAERTP